MPSPALNNTTLTNLLNTMSSSDYSTFASDMTTSFVGAWSSRFALTSRQNSALSSVPLAMQSALINTANYASGILSAGNLLDAIGSAFDSNPSGPMFISIKVETGVDSSFNPLTGETTGSIYIKVTIEW